MNKRIRLLLIDDDPDLRHLAEYNLRLDGFQVWEAADGPTGLKLALKKKPEVILLDVEMPRMDGLEVLSELKHQRKTEKIPVFMLTAKRTIGDIERAFSIGADDYIVKPFEARTLSATVKRKMAKCIVASGA